MEKAVFTTAFVSGQRERRNLIFWSHYEEKFPVGAPAAWVHVCMHVGVSQAFCKGTNIDSMLN
jgi:hypothetical protein